MNKNLAVALCTTLLHALPLSAQTQSPTVTTASAAAEMAGSPAGTRPELPVWDADSLTRTCHAGLQALQRQVATLEQLPLAAATTDTVFRPWNQLQIQLEDIESPVYLLSNVAPDPKVRAAAEPCLLAYNKFGSRLFQNAALYQRLRAVKPNDAVDAKLQQDLLEAFEDTGVALPAEKKQRMQQILERLEVLRQEFDRNIRDNPTRLSFTPGEVQGLPAAYLARAQRDQHGQAGNYLLGFDYPEYVPFMENAQDAAARQRYQSAFANRGGERNLQLLDETLRLRHEMAALFGQASYADFVLRRRMAGTAAKVNGFLDAVMAQVRAIELRDLEELRQTKAQALGVPLAQTQLQRWDVAYYQERLKQQRYDIDQEALRQYFPTTAVLRWALATLSALYDIRFHEASERVTRWHPEVRYFDVSDRRTGEFLGGIYLDLYPREGKYSHAAAFAVRGASRLDARQPRTPISVLVTNFDRQGLNFNELETLMHELGHVMHGVLSRTRYVDQAGTRVERDFVEAPSQMFEAWAQRLETVSLIADYCRPACKRVDADMMQRLDAARKFGRGIQYARQHLYASYDLALYGARSSHRPDALGVWQQMEAATPLGHTPGTQFPGQFSHIVHGYGAGYYGYMWSEVLALDMLAQFGDPLMNPTIGQRFRHEILERGGERRGADMVRDFLGRDPEPQAFFAEITGQRPQ